MKHIQYSKKIDAGLITLATQDDPGAVALDAPLLSGSVAPVASSATLAAGALSPPYVSKVLKMFF